MNTAPQPLTPQALAFLGIAAKTSSRTTATLETPSIEQMYKEDYEYSEIMEVHGLSKYQLQKELRQLHADGKITMRLGQQEYVDIKVKAQASQLIIDGNSLYMAQALVEEKTGRVISTSTIKNWPTQKSVIAQLNKTKH